MTILSSIISSHSVSCVFLETLVREVDSPDNVMAVECVNFVGQDTNNRQYYLGVSIGLLK